MPIYTYICPACGKFHELIVSLSQRDNQECEVCSHGLKLVTSVPAKRATGFAGKGGGRSDGIVS